jgi:hypothetical protein
MRVRLTPFGPERSLPRRPPGVDLARLFRQAILAVAAPIALFAVIGFLNRPGHTSRAFCVGLAVTALSMAAMWGYSWIFEVQHPDQPPEFWRRQESKMRPRIFVAFCLGLLAGTATIVVSLHRGDAAVAAFAIAPTFLCFSLVVLMWGKVP